MARNRDSILKTGNEIYNWFNAITKKIAKKHPDIEWGYEKDNKDDKMWTVFSGQNTVLLKLGYDLMNGNFVYEYLADLNGKFGLKAGMTPEKKDLLSLLPKLEEIDAYKR
jgi:hypothetical protein